MGIKAILFDLDGVLIDSGDWHELAFLRALEEAGHPLDRGIHSCLLNGLSTRQKMQILSAQGKLPRLALRQVAERKRELTASLLKEHCRPDENLKQLLRRLGQRATLGVCTNSISSTLRTVLSKLEITDFFEVLLSNEDVAFPKPDPEIYRLAMLRLGLHHSEVLILEDSPTGIAAAQASRARVQPILSPTELFELDWEGLLSHETPALHPGL